jgi:outer membrane protein TolC
LRYRAGIAPITELLLAQRNLQQARSARVAATHRWNLSRAGLELETGLSADGGAAVSATGAETGVVEVGPYSSESSNRRLP